MYLGRIAFLTPLACVAAGLLFSVKLSIFGTIINNK